MAGIRLLRSLFDHLSQTFKAFNEKGLRIGLARLGKMVKRIFYIRRERVVLARSLSDNDIATETPSRLVVHQVRTNKDLERITSLADPTDAARLRKMFDNGSVAFFALLDGQLAGWGWISYQIDPGTNRSQVPLLPGDACLHDLFVLPAYRGLRIAQSLINCRWQLLREQSYKRSVISCAKDDIPPLIVAQRAGYIEIGESCHTRFLFWDRLEYKLSEAEETYRVQTIVPADEAG